MRKCIQILALSLVGALCASMAAWAAAPDTSKFVTVTYVMLGNKPTNGQFEKVEAKWNAIFKERVNAHLELKWVEWADWQTKYNLLLASGEPLDLITTATDWLDAWPNAQRGAFMNLDELLPVYAPQTWAEVPPEHWEQCKYNGKIVMIPEDHYTQWINHGIFYRGDWAKEAGIELPIKDWETLGKYFQSVKEKHGIIPFEMDGTNGALMAGWYDSHTPSLALPMVPTGWVELIRAKSYDEKYTAWSPVFDQTFVDFAKMMKEWGDKGYWREDVLNFKIPDQNTLIRSGKTGGDQHHTQTYRTLRVFMDKEQPGSDLQFFAFGEVGNNLISMSITHGATALGAYSKNPERALMVYDIIRHDEEVYRLFNYGLEGVQYVIENGVMKRPAGYDEARDRFYSDFWGGRVDKFELPMDMVWPRIGEVYQRYDQIKKPYPYERFVFNKAPVEAELAAISNIGNQLGMAIAFGKAGDPEKAVEELRKKMKAAGYEKVLAEVQKQLDEYKKLVEGQ
ncbi:extracellular solute-binding protein family 1 [Candidatus Moduliflexus flocculans]|uniref:Extracellular solute-binding protein family 1 n=1 Tax=Candidatus Moduliflexus flocculans TaxID=1499966 RepID=A0A081BQ56_9BACT|nr:extracellular solute-binding protein family 1 [Candidatus Moduliflexus flocculans]